MLKALIGIQLRAAFALVYNRSRSRKKKKPLSMLLMVVLTLYILFSLSLATGFLFKQMYDAFIPPGLAWLYFALAGIAGFAISVLGSVYLAYAGLFHAQDNELLLSLPIKPRLILLSRTLSLYLMVLVMQGIVLLPAAAVYLAYTPQGSRILPIFAAIYALLPLLSLVPAILLGWLVSLLAQRVKHKNLMIILFSLAMTGLYLYAYTRMMDNMTLFLQQGEQIARAVERALFPAYHLGIAMASQSLGSLLVFAACCLTPFALTLLLVSRNYQTILTTRRGTRKTAYKGGSMQAGSPMRALITKEFRSYFARPIYLLNCAFPLLFLIGLPLYLLFDASLLDTVHAILHPSQDMIGALTVLSLSAISSSINLTAPSISLEGNSFWLLRTLPVTALQSLLGKAAAHVLLCAPAIALSALLMGIQLRLSFFYLAMALLVPLCVCLFSALLGLLFNLHFPKMAWRSETEVVKQSMSAFFSMMTSFLSVGSLAAIYLMVLSPVVAPPLFLLFMLVLFAALSLALFLYLRTHAQRLYMRISEG